MKEILIPLNFTTTPTVYDTKQSFSTSDEASGVLNFTTTADVAGTVASLTIRNASENANRQTVLIERLDVNSSPFSYTLKNPLPFGQYEGTVLLKKNLTVIASATFLFGVNSSLSAEVLPDLVKAYSLDELVENVETEVSNLKDAFNLTVSETVKGVNKTESTLQAQENVRYLNEHTRKANEQARIAAELERKDTFDTLVDSAVIEQTVVQEVAEKYQEIEALNAPEIVSFRQQLEQTDGRIDNLLVDGTPTEGNSMLLDGAISADGTDNLSVGTNIRKTQSGEAILDRAITTKKLSFIENSKNLFNKATTIDGKTISWSTGELQENSAYFVSDKITGQTGDSITITGQSNITYVLLDASGAYKRGLNITQNPLTITLAEGEAQLIISAGLSRKELIQVEKGMVATDYVPYSEKIPLSLIPSSVTGEYVRVKLISSAGDGDYDTIQSAVDASVDGDVIMVFPGTYNESINMRTKDISIVGTDKTRCILKYTSGAYADAPLNAAKGSIRNMTIYHEKLAGATWDGTSLLGYAIHIDFAESIGKTLRVEDCIIKSDWNSVLGIGFQNNSKLILKNNEIIQTGNMNNVPTKGALYAHNVPNANAEFIMDGNTLVVDEGNVMSIDEVYDSSTGISKCTFINNNLVSKTKGVTDVVLLDTPTGGAFSGATIFNAVNSYGNNVAVLNAS